MKIVIQIIVIVFLLISTFTYGQNYTSEIQLDLTISGKTKVGYNKATIFYSKQSGEITIKFDALKSQMSFKITEPEIEVFSDHTQTLYYIVNSLNFTTLKVEEYIKRVAVENHSYDATFLIGGFDNDRMYYTTFYAKKK